MRSIKRGFSLFVVLSLAASLLAATGCAALHSRAEEMLYKSAKEPLFIFKDDSVYIVSGSSFMELPDAGVMEYGGDWYLDGMLSEDNKYLYYLTDVDEIGYFGTLHVVETQSPAAPLKIADNVYSARLSADGKTLLYVTDVKEDTGKLYRRSTGGESSLVAESVHSGRYGASCNGEQIYYIAKEEQGYKDTYTLYAQYGQQDAMALDEVSSSYADNIIAHFTVDGSGTMLYSLCTKELSSSGDIYIKKAGEEAVAVDKGRVEKTVNGAEEFFYTNGGILYYKAPERDPIQAGKWNDKFLVQPYYGMNPDHVYESRFLLDNANGREHVLAELLSDGSKNVIAEGDFDYYKINAGFTCVAYEQDGALYAVQKKNGQWGKPQKQCVAAKRYFFDDAGSALYYIALDKEDDDNGDAYRLSLSGGEADLLQRDAYSLWLCDDVPHSLTEDYGGYRIENRPVRLDDPRIGPCRWLDETEGGYIVIFYRKSGDEYKNDIYFTEDGTGHVLVLEGVGEIVDIWGTSELF